MNRLRAVFNKLMGRELVGRDAHGNHYYLFFESKGWRFAYLSGWLADESARVGAKPRRQVDYKDGDIEPETIPPEWRAWLWNSRETVPTETELAKGVADRAKFAARVQEIENADKKERMRMQKGQEAKSQEGGGKPENVYLARAMSKIEGDAKASGRPRVS
eukprot:tig00000076_g2409.t1